MEPTKEHFIIILASYKRNSTQYLTKTLFKHTHMHTHTHTNNKAISLQVKFKISSPLHPLLDRCKMVESSGHKNVYSTNY